MLSFAVFFADEAAVDVTRVDAPDAATAESMVMEEHPGAKVHAVDGATVTEKNRVRMLAAWMREGWQFHPDFTQQSAISIERQS